MDVCMRNSLFYLGVGFLFTHELDAVSNHEWRVLPLTSWLPDEYGELVFVLAHVPIFAILSALLASQNIHIRNKTKFFISAFLVIHALLHMAFLMHGDYEFNSLLSNFLIFAGAICGLAYLALKQNQERV